MITRGRRPFDDLLALDHEIVGFVKTCELFKAAVMNNEHLTVKDAIQRKMVRVYKASVRVSKADPIVDIYRKLNLHRESIALVFDEHMVNIGYLRLRDIQLTLLEQLYYFPQCHEEVLLS